jgi:hypothetical protein
MEGAMYEQFPRHGKMVSLPHPFVFDLAPANAADKSVSLIFYDNAGEHFNPNVSIEDSPGALHVASSAGILFLLDPTANPLFRASLAGFADPQLSINITDQQDTILAEMGVRIRTIAGKTVREKIDTPLAIVLGKCDVWEHLLPHGETFVRPVSNGKLDMAALDKNSNLIRDLLLEIDAPLVAVAESISTHVRFFPASSFSHSPVVIEDGPNAGKLAPDPAKLKPRMVEIPLLWILSLTQPELIPHAE